MLSLSLKSIAVNAPFQQLGLDFIREINPSSSGQHKWILTTTYFFTKWVEAIPTRNATDKVIIDFIEENILSRFGCPWKILTDNAKAFKSKDMGAFCEKNGILLKHSTPYYPQENGLVESSNKNSIQSIRNLLNKNKWSWDSMSISSYEFANINFCESLDILESISDYGAWAFSLHGTRPPCQTPKFFKKFKILKFT